MKSKLSKIKCKIYKIFLDDIPVYTDDSKQFSFNKEIVLREISSFKWFLSICISIYIAMIVSLLPVFQAKEFENEVSNISKIVSNIEGYEVCSYPVKFYKFNENLGLSQFKTSFRKVIDNYFRDKGLDYRLKYQSIDKLIFENYPKTESCIADYKKRYNLFVNEELSFSQAREILENHVWMVAFPIPIVESINEQLMENRPSKKSIIGMYLCKIEFDDSKEWKATLAINDCKIDNFFIGGKVSWEDIKLGPLSRDFKESFQLLNKYWMQISQININEREKIKNRFFNTIKVYVPFLKVELQLDRSYVQTYILIQILILCILFIKGKNLRLKSENFSITFPDYYTKLSRYLPLTFLYILLCFLNYEMLLYFINAPFNSIYWMFYLLFMVIITVFLYIGSSFQLLNKKYVIGMVSLGFICLLVL